MNKIWSNWPKKTKFLISSSRKGVYSHLEGISDMLGLAGGQPASVGIRHVRGSRCQSRSRIPPNHRRNISPDTSNSPARQTSHDLKFCGEGTLDSSYRQHVGLEQLRNFHGVYKSRWSVYSPIQNLRTCTGPHDILWLGPRSLRMSLCGVYEFSFSSCESKKDTRYLSVLDAVLSRTYHGDRS